MKLTRVIRSAALCGCVAFAAVTTRAAEPQITTVPIASVQLQDSFWKPRMEINRTVTIPLLLERIETSGKLANFTAAAAALKGQPATGGAVPNAWDDAEVYKTIGDASYTLFGTPDPKLEARLDALIATIAAAQESDGYIYTPRTMNPKQPPQYAGAERWVNEKAESYELYDLGCLFDAASAHARATGKKNFLAVATKAADLLDSTFGPGKKAIWPGHPMVEYGLVKMFRATNDARYWKLAQFMIDQRGPEANAPPATGRGGRGGPARGPGSAYSQAQGKFVDATQALGQAPGAMNLYVGAADIAGYTGEASYLAALDKIWDNLVGSKIYITGGIASDNTGVFPRNYLLNSVNAYSSTDAAATSIMLNRRLFQLHGDAKYIDALERTLYNALLAGVSFDGKVFFDTQPLEFAPIGPVTGRGSVRATRRDTFNTAFSPTIAAHTLAVLPELFYAQSSDAVYVNLYGQSTATIKLANGRTIIIEQQTSYPANGAIKLTVTPDQTSAFALKLRLPAWARQVSSPGGLYSNTEKTKPVEVISLKLNGAPQSLDLSAPFATLSRQWSPGDTVELTLPIAPHQIQASEQVADARNRVAIERGPLIFCAEAADNNGKVRNLIAPSNLTYTASSSLLGGIPTLTGRANAISVDDQDKRIATEQPITLIPYFAWANRGPGEMTTWFAGSDAVAVASSKPTLIATARFSASPRSDGPTNPQACRDGIEPRASSDNSPLSHFDWWPSTNGKLEWVAAEWDTPQTLTSTSVYWWDDSGVGECRPPASWKAFYKDDQGNWRPVPTSDPFATDKDKYNRINFSTPLKTTGIKLECIMPQSTGTQRLSVGIQEWKIR